MSSYALKKIYHYSVDYQNQTIEGKINFKTKSLDWVGTRDPVIVPISIHTAFHEGILGELKMKGFISIIKNNVKGKITILLTEKAHLHALSLKYENNTERAFHEVYLEAKLLSDRFREYFEGCQIDYWFNFINQDPDYPLFCQKVMQLYANDAIFKQHVHEDAEKTYTIQRESQFPDKALFIRQSIKDILENCVYLFVIANKSCRYQFYPGSDIASRGYLTKYFLRPEQHVYVNVSIKIEKSRVI